MTNIDNIDRLLIGLLRKDARMPVATLAKKIQVSRATVQNRLAKLEKNGVITGYTVLVSAADNNDNAIKAIMCIELKGNSSQTVKAKLMSEPSVCAIHNTNGRWDMLVELQTNSLAEFDKILSRIRSVNEVAASETNMLLSSHRISAQQI